MLELTQQQYDIVYNAFSLAIAVMGASFLFFVFSRERVSPRYRPAVVVSALVVAIAAYHYVQIFLGWGRAFEFTGSGFVASGAPFNEGYRYADWLLTVPLLLVELVAVLGITDARARGRLLWSLVVAAVLMIALGYPGEISDDATTRIVWGALSTIPFLYIVGVLFFRLRSTLESQPANTRKLFNGLRWVILATWGVYPIVYLFPLLGIDGATAEVGLQVGYTVADILAKAGYGLIIFTIALRKSRAEDEEIPTQAGIAQSEGA